MHGPLFRGSIMYKGKHIKDFNNASASFCHLKSYGLDICPTLTWTMLDEKYSLNFMQIILLSKYLQPMSLPQLEFLILAWQGFLPYQCCMNRNRPFAWSGQMVQNKLCWDANNALGLPKQRKSYQSSPTFLCFERLPPRCLRPTIIYSTSCYRIMPKAYFKTETNFHK